ncbi:MAG: hypothetical protein IPK94_08470 [Saprospiraceae bacterium]|nr:hypothetical protein [Saprospiraceae bacterium]
MDELVVHIISYTVNSILSGYLSIKHLGHIAIDRRAVELATPARRIREVSLCVLIRDRYVYLVKYRLSARGYKSRQQ